jgi:hypothetical protein
MIEKGIEMEKDRWTCQKNQSPVCTGSYNWIVKPALHSDTISGC